MRAINKRLTIFTKQEQFALYGLPDFSDEQRAEYLTLTKSELQLILSRPTTSAQIYCALQIGYFKTKDFFFDFSFEEIAVEDIQFITQNYFSEISVENLSSISKHEYYEQRSQISKLFDYKLWSQLYEPEIDTYLSQIIKRDVTISFVLDELLTYFRRNKIIRPGCSTLQKIISKNLKAERTRLGHIIMDQLDESLKKALDQILVRENSLSGLTILKQDAQNFNYTMLLDEIKKLKSIRSLYLCAKKIFPLLKISQKNLCYYAELAHYYTITKLCEMKPQQSYLYLLCYIWQRYQQLVDNLIEMFNHHQKRLDDESKETANEEFFKQAQKQQKQVESIGRLLHLYVDDTLNDYLQFGAVREKAFSILPKERIAEVANQFIIKQITPMDFRWRAIDKIMRIVKKYLRPLFMNLEIESSSSNNVWLSAAQNLKKYITNPDTAKSNDVKESLITTIPKQLKPYLLTTDSKTQTTILQMDRYEFWLYRKCKKLLKIGQLHIDDSFNHRSFEQELIPLADKDALKKQLDLPVLQTPIRKQLQELSEEVKELWQLFDKRLKQGELAHLEFNPETKEFIWHRLQADKEEEENQQYQFYSQVPQQDIIDVLRFVNARCNFLSAFTPLQPRYAKQPPDENTLYAGILAQALNHGNLKMSKICDISYDALDYVGEQYIRISTLKAASNIISNYIQELSIFPYYSMDLVMLIGDADGQKYELLHPTIKARHASKYFGTGRGVVAYTLLANHIPLQTKIIGPHELEGHYLFDILSSNTTNIIPNAVTGDMHSENKANFFTLYCFKTDYYLRFTNLKEQLKNLYCCDDLANYSDYWIKPVGKINLDLIEEQWDPYIERIIVTLAQKETTQSIIMKKLCTHMQTRTLKAIYEYDKLIRTRYTLKYLMDRKLQKNVERSRNRIETYHQLRATISQAYGKKQLYGHNDIEIDVSNQCGRLVALDMICYNSIILSLLRDKCQYNNEIMEKVKKRSPVASQHIHLSGHYTFGGDAHLIDLETLIDQLKLD
jgi:TnpA family transposase